MRVREREKEREREREKERERERTKTKRVNYSKINFWLSRVNLREQNFHFPTCVNMVEEVRFRFLFE